MRQRTFRSVLCSIFIAAILASCTGMPVPGLETPTPVPPTPTPYQQALPPSLVETTPLDNTSIGQLSPITFYFSEPMDKASVEFSFQGLPEGSFTWNDESTVVFNPAQPYSANSELPVTIASSIKSANGFGIQQPIDLSFRVADYLRPSNILPKENAANVDVESAVVVSFNQPVVPLGAEPSALPAAFSIEPSVEGKGEWINTSTYILYPEPAMTGGTQYTIRLNPDLKTAVGVGLEPGAASEWTFTTSLPGVVSLLPSSEQQLAIEPQILLTFNQPMDTESVVQNFSFSGPEGALKGSFEWSEGDTVLSFVPDGALERNAGYLLNIDAAAKSRGGLALGEDYGALYRTFDQFAVTGTDVQPYVVTFIFSSPLAKGDYDEFVKVDPALDNMSTSLSEDGLSLQVYGDYQPETNYSIEIAAQLRDAWKQSLGDPFVFNFRTAPATPMLNVNIYNSGTAFVRPDDPALYARAVNVQSADVTVAPITIQEYLLMQNSYENQQAFSPSNSMVYPHTFNLPPSETKDVKLRLAQQGSSLMPGLYYVQVASPQIESPAKSIYFAISSQVNLTFKLGATEALVWAVDLPSQTPVANAPVTLYDSNGSQLITGTTDQNGLWKGSVQPQEGAVYAVLGTPGSENFAMATSSWNLGINPWDFGYSYNNRQPPHTDIYMYTDRPMYRPGQTVYFRGVVRQAFNGRYELPQINEVPLTLRDANGTQLLSLNAQLSPYGTFNGAYELAEDAVPGYYSFQNDELALWFGFQVAEYRKPEIDLKVDFSADEIQPGEQATAQVSSRYFFDAPVNNMEVRWSLYSRPDTFSLPNYDTGLLDTSWLDFFRNPPPGSGYFGTWVKDGTGKTDREGLLSIELPELPQSESGQLLTLEVSAMDEAGLPVSARSQMSVHPADFYIGIRPDQWIGRADSPIGFEIYTVDWAQNPSGDKSLEAVFQQVRWEKEENSAGFPSYKSVYEPVSSSNLTTGPDGKARLSFVPPTPGTYMLDVSGGGTRSQSMIWVSGAGSAAWPDLPNQRLEIRADKETYKAGDTARIFIPNPFPVNSQALVTVERGVISQSEVITLTGSGREYSLPLTEADAPNVYVSAIVLGQGNEFRGGLVNLPVAPDDKELNVQVTASPAESEPRQDLTFDVQVTDNQGAPVEGEFSLAVVDKASLALAEPNSKDILSAFYSIQPLGVETGLSVAAYTGRDANLPVGGGGGGGGEVPFIREKFPDTAYWNPSLVTNSDGRGQVIMTLPDSLTTWQVDVRGLTVETKVGETSTQVVATKPLLVRPVTPRFLVSGDHVQMAAIVNNNTSDRLTVDVKLQSEGFILDEPGKAVQQVAIPANGRVRVDWWGTAGPAQAADLVFSAVSTDAPTLQDSTRPSWGQLPILHYNAPQAFVTGGILRGESSQQEVISLPRTFTPNGGGLNVEVSPSLAGSLLTALEEMEEPDSTSAESMTSYYLPNLEVYQSLSGASLNDPALTDRVASTTDSNVHSVLRLQNEDGGWNWWGSTPIGSQTTPSDPYISAFVTFGLIRAHRAGVSVDETALQRAGSYLRGLNHEIISDTTGAQLDEIAFIQFVLAQAATYDEMTINNLYNARDRMSPYSQALLASIINSLNPADERTRDLVSNLEANAITTAASAHWETPRESIVSRGSPIYTTALVVYVLSQLDPANQVLFNAVNYLAAHRNARGLWNMGHDNAWAILALNQAMLGFGDLNADFKYNATFNGGPLLNGEVAGAQVLAPSTAQVPLEYISPSSPNLLNIQRTDGMGRLYYHTVLDVTRPVEEVQPLDSGLQIERVYCQSTLADVNGDEPASKGCSPITSLQLNAGQSITARLTLTVPNDSYYVTVEDYIPAGMEILNRNLKTSQQAVDATEIQVQFDDKDPYANGWGWWLFHDPQIRDDSIRFSADYLPAGIYVLTYTLIPLQAGEYRVLPAHAWESFFPEVQGTSAGVVFEIKP